MKAILLPDLVPGSPEWMTRMTASKVSAVLGLSPWESPFSLWHRMAGLMPQQEETSQTKRGHYLESAVADWFMDQHVGEFGVGPGRAWQHRDRAWQAASPDRLLWPTSKPEDPSRVDWPLALLEVKTTAVDDEWGDAGTDQIPPYYRCQVVWQLDTLGLDVAYVAVLLPRLEFREYRIQYNADEAAYLRAECRAFLDSLPGGPAEQRPDLDASSATYQAVKALNPDIDGTDVVVPHRLAREFCEASRGFAAASTRYDLARVEVADLMGQAKRAVWLDRDEKPHKLADRRGASPYMQAVAAKSLPAIPEEIPA